MSSIEELKDIEEEIRFMETDRQHRPLNEVIDEILAKDKAGKREFATGQRDK